MRSFVHHLKEFAVYSTSDYVFTQSDHIPISGPMMKRIWPKSIRATVFHATDLKGLHKLVKMEGGKKTISAFFSMMGKYMMTGVATEGGIVAEMEADVLVSARDDIMSQVDKAGRRWVTLDWFEQAARNSLGRGRFSMVIKEFKKLKEDLVAKHVPHMAKSGPLEVWKEMKDYLKYNLLRPQHSEAGLCLLYVKQMFHCFFLQIRALGLLLQQAHHEMTFLLPI